jgi:hypothetical protein
MRRIIKLLLITTTLVSCEKEIDIDYHEATPQYVVEASLTNSLATVRVTQTVPMKGSQSSDRVVENATVVISSGDSVRQTARYSSNGNYIYPLKAYPGTLYQVDIDVDGHHFSSSSILQPQPKVNKFRFVWKKMMSTRILFADLTIQDFPGQQNYYFIHMYRNNIGYRWTITRDTSNPGKELQQLLGCIHEDFSDDEDALHNGDKIRIEVRAIDRASYDYLFSLSQAANNGSNPVANFTGGCLGYFSAYIPYTINATYQEDETEEE